MQSTACRYVLLLNLKMDPVHLLPWNFLEVLMCQLRDISVQAYWVYTAVDALAAYMNHLKCGNIFKQQRVLVCAPPLPSAFCYCVVAVTRRVGAGAGD